MVVRRERHQINSQACSSLAAVLGRSQSAVEGEPVVLEFVAAADRTRMGSVPGEGSASSEGQSGGDWAVPCVSLASVCC